MRRPWNKARFLELLAQVKDQTATSYEELARLSEVSPSNFSRWRDGKTQPSFEALRRLALAVRKKRPDLDGTMRDLIEAAGFGIVDLGPLPAPGQVPAEIASIAEEAGVGPGTLWAYGHVKTLWNTPVYDQRTKELLILSFAEVIRDQPAEPGRRLRRA
jgi:transcriptional regulator with XRE-family HTH domain